MNASEMIALAEKMSHEYTDGRINNTSETAGAYREVFLHDQYAFKAVGRDCDIDTNRAEFDFYTMTTDEIRAKLAKPVYISRNGRVIVMERVTPWRKAQPELSAYKTASEIEAFVNKIHGCNIGDLHDGNFGIRDNGEIVVIDYGSIMYVATRWEARRARAADENDCYFPSYRKEIMAEMLLSFSC